MQTYVKGIYDLDVEQYAHIKTLLIEFGYNQEMDIDAYIFRNHGMFISPMLKEKMLLLECYNDMDYCIAHPHVFAIAAHKLYSFSNYYKNDMFQDNKCSFVTFVTHSEYHQKALEKYPITKEELDKKIKLCERVHNAKKNAKNKSGGVSL